MNDFEADLTRQLSEHATRIAQLEQEALILRSITVKLAAMTVDVMTAVDSSEVSSSKQAFKDIKKTLNLMKRYSDQERATGDSQFLSGGDDVE